MPEVRDVYTEAEKLDVTALHIRIEELRSKTPGFAEGKPDYKKLDEPTLCELLACTRALRRKAAAPGGPGGRKKSPKEKPTIKDLA